MRPKWKRRVVQIAAGTLGALALNAGAQAAFTSYSASAGAGAASLGSTSTAIDLGSLMTGFSVLATLGLTIGSDVAITLTAPAGVENVQTVQGCVNAAASCAGLWTDISGFALGGTGGSFTQTQFPQEVAPFSTGTVTYSGPAIQSLRLSFDTGISAIGAGGSVGTAGTLTVTAVPEPGTWALLLAGVAGVAGIARRRLMV
jgi:hypothetical protein